MVNKIIFIVPYPIGESPSQRFRFEQYLDVLKAANFEVQFEPFIDTATFSILYQSGNTLQKVKGYLRAFWRRMVLMTQIKRSDIVFIHREVAHVGPPVFEWILAKVLRVKYIYDFDDAIWLPNYSVANAKLQGLKMYWKVNYAMKWAYKITAGNAYLADYARQFNENVSIIPTTIDTDHHHTILAQHSDEKVVIGWTGTHSTMHYLDEIVPVIERLEKEFTFEFRVISNKAPDFQLRSLNFVPWNKSTEIEDLSALHIGVMPLTADRWSAGKCGFKGLQYMALGTVCLMSPVGVNTTIVQDGVNGFLVSSETEWYERLKQLLQDVELRKSIGEKGRERIVDHYSVRAIQERFLRIFVVAMYER